MEYSNKNVLSLAMLKVCGDVDVFDGLPCMGEELAMAGGGGIGLRSKV